MGISRGELTLKRRKSQKNEEERTVLHLRKRAGLWRAGGVLLFSVGLAVRVTVVHVLAVGAGVREALEALGALEGLFAAVQPLVFSQMMLVLERSWTLHAFIWPLP